MSGYSSFYIRVLAAEDNESHRKVIKLMLNRLGYESDVVPSAQEAIKAVKREHYDLALIDIAMPEMDGLQATEEIRKLGQNSLTIIGVTAYDVHDIKEKCISSGMNDCIIKPIRIKELEETLKKYVDSRNSNLGIQKATLAA